MYSELYGGGWGGMAVELTCSSELWRGDSQRGGWGEMGLLHCGELEQAQVQSDCIMPTFNGPGGEGEEGLLVFLHLSSFGSSWTESLPVLTYRAVLLRDKFLERSRACGGSVTAENVVQA